MALTQISTAGVKDDAVTSGKIPANAVGSSELADNAVDTAAIADDAVTFEKIENITANQVLGRVASGTGEVQALSGAHVRSIINVADGATNSPTTTINNEADNRVLTATSTANTIQGEPNVTVGGQGDLHIKDPGNTAYTNFTGGTDAGIIIGNGLLDSAGVQLRTGTSGTCRLNFGDGDGTSSDRSRGFITYLHSSNDLTFGSNASERMRIDSSGKVLLGTTTSAAGQLIVKDVGDAGNQLWIIGRASNNTGSVSFRNNADDAYVARIQADTANDLQFQVDGSERMRIDSNGKMLIGTTNAQHYSDRVVTISRDAGAGIELRNSSNATGQVSFSDTSGSGVGAYRGYIQYQHNSNSMCFGTESGERFRITSGGVSFNGDTAAANKLDDYEEGTWTPTSSAITLSGTIAGHYTKIGDLCYVSCIFQVPSTSNTNDIEINGLPFNGKNGTDGNYIQGGYVIYHNQGGGPYTVLVANGTNQLIVYQANGQRQTFNQFAGAHLRLAAVYKVA